MAWSPNVDGSPRWWRIKLDARDQTQWYLKGPRPAPDAVGAFDPWQFRRGQRIEPASPLVAEVRQAGTPQDWTFASEDTPILSEKAATALGSVVGDGIQLLPVEVDEVPGEYFVLNVLALVDVIDVERTVGVRFDDDHPRRAGDWRRVNQLVLRSDAVDGHVLLYPSTWRVALCAAEDVVVALRSSGITGIDFRPLTVS